MFSLMDLEYGFFFLQADMKLLGSGYLLILISSTYIPLKIRDLGFGFGFESLARFGFEIRIPEKTNL